MGWIELNCLKPEFPDWNVAPKSHSSQMLHYVHFKSKQQKQKWLYLILSNPI